MYLLIPPIMVQFVSVDTTDTYCTIINGILDILPLLVVSADTYCTLINGINRYILYQYNMYLMIPFIMVQYVSVDTTYNGTICIC
jgi:hypothetical protein